MNEKTSVWSLGLLFLYYWKGKLPFEKMLDKAGHDDKLLAGIENIGGPVLPGYKDANYRRFIGNLLLKYRDVIVRPVNFKRWKSGKCLFWTGGQCCETKPYVMVFQECQI